MPRVISGDARRTPLVTPKGRDTRPTADKAKEGMFNVLQSRMSFADIEVLELFAGSGQLAIEALSRGASRALLVDKSREARQAQEQNLRKCHLESRAELKTMEVGRALEECRRKQRRFDLILADPPYALAAEAWKRLERTLVELLKPGGVLVWECSADEEEPRVVTVLQRFQHCHYGAAMVSFYMNDGAAVSLQSDEEG